MNKKIILIFFCLIYTTLAFCQDAYIDSLNHIIKNPETDSQKISTQLLLAKYYYYNIQSSDSAINILIHSIDFAKSKNLFHQADINKYWLTKFSFLEETPDILEYALAQIDSASKRNLKDIQSKFLSLAAQYTENKDSANLLVLQALLIAKQHSLLAEETYAFIALGGLQLKSKPDSANKYFQQALNVSNNTDIDTRIDALLSIANYWADYKQSAIALNYLHQAIWLAKNNNRTTQ